MASGKIVADILEQCASIGDLHHALEAGAVTREDVYAELGEIITGGKPGRTPDEEIVIFDSTDMALQDAAAAAVVYEKALRAGVGVSVNRQVNLGAVGGARNPGTGEPYSSSYRRKFTACCSRFSLPWSYHIIVFGSRCFDIIWHKVVNL